MKCQKCEKPATFHITEIVEESVQELHLCEDHARDYLSMAEPVDESPSLSGMLAQQIKVGQTADELARLDQRACPVCGITFYEFRSQGRLGCPHDYVCFEAELMPLLINIHGETSHNGKKPKHAGGSERQTRLIQLRREMKECIANEDYERASQIRDEIRVIEGSRAEVD